jgi:hypothetical protein
MISLGPQLSLADERRHYAPGEVLAGFFSLGALEFEEVRALELSVLWQTEGKGDEDMAVHYFRRWESSAPQWPELKLLQPFATHLPNSPLSYSGMILNICWRVRLRAVLRQGKDILIDLPFELGAVPPPAIPAEQSPV